jgi:predicted acetyltransferase
MTAVSEALALRPIAADEFDSLYALARTAFHDPNPPEDGRDVEYSVFEPGRSIGVYDNETLVGAAGAYTRDMTVPGGPMPVACVTWVSVAAEYTRRGLLTRMMRHQLNELHERGGEPVAALWASESGIYGRYGYGLAARHARITANLRELRLVRPVPSAERRIRTGEAANPVLRSEVAAVYERVRTTVAGHCDRRGAWWDFRLHDPESGRHGAGPLRLAIHDGPTGPDGYVAFSVNPKWQDDGPHSTANLSEFCAETPDASAALWSFVFSLGLVGELSYRIAPNDTPLLHMVDQPRRLKVGLMDNLWVRLVDVGRALAARAYAAPVDVVFDVSDEFCPWNAGRWRLQGGPAGAVCARTTDEPDMALTSTELGAAYLGGTTLDALARAGLVRELKTGALRTASTAFAEPRTPFCPEVF